MSKHLCFFLLLLVGCASVPGRRALKIEPGMSKQEVIEIAGEPSDRSFKGSQERWIYSGGLADQPGKVITFRSGKVVELENAPPPAAPGATATPPVAVIPPNGPIPDLPCADRNQYGSFAEGGGCNMYGCWPPGGYCNGFGCSAQGTCTNRRCPRPIETYRCVE